MFSVEEATVINVKRCCHGIIALYAVVDNPASDAFSLRRCLQPHGIGHLPDVEGDAPAKTSKSYPIGYFHIDITEVRTEQGKRHMFVVIDRM